MAVLSTVETIGDRVRVLRQQRGIRQGELAQRIHASANAINMLEVGLITNPHADRIVALAQALECSTDYLLGLSDDPQART